MPMVAEVCGTGLFRKGWLCWAGEAASETG